MEGVRRENKPIGPGAAAAFRKPSFDRLVGIE